MLTQSGVPVDVAFMTRGEQGIQAGGTQSLQQSQALAELRSREARAACGVLGVREVRIRNNFTAGCRFGPYHFKTGRFDNQCDVFHFWSPHPGGAHFLFADGSVHFISESVNTQIFASLITRALKEIVSDGAY